ncbi:unnamed protein product [Effrenium voratum]|nr:unnamed protein product [Effrenium voratum]
MHSAEVALEAWALLQPEAVSAPEPELAASLPNVVDRLHHGDSIQEETLLALSRSCPLPARRAEAPLITLRRSLEQSRAKGGDVQFLSFWRTLGEAARQSDVGGPATPTLPPSCRLPHLSPLSEASPGLTTPRCGNVMEELEELRDALLDRFEEVGDRLSLVAFQDEVRSMQKRSSTPVFWAEVLEAHSEGGPGSLSISEVTVLLLALLRDAAAWQLTLSPSHLHTGFATLPQNGEGGQAEDLSILAKHLRQALDTDTSPQDLSRPLWTSSVTGCETCTGGYVAADSPSAPRRHLRSAMLSLQDEADDSPGGWMRTAMLPLRGPCADEAAELRDTPREAAAGTLDSNATIPMPLLSDPGDFGELQLQLCSTKTPRRRSTTQAVGLKIGRGQSAFGHGRPCCQCPHFHRWSQWTPAPNSACRCCCTSMMSRRSGASGASTRCWQTRGYPSSLEASSTPVWRRSLGLLRICNVPCTLACHQVRSSTIG